MEEKHHGVQLESYSEPFLKLTCKELSQLHLSSRKVDDEIQAVRLLR